MQITIDASNPPSIEVFLGTQEIGDIVSFSIEVDIHQLPVFKMRQLVMQDGKPVLNGEGFKFVDTKFPFEKLSFTGDWSIIAKILIEKKWAELQALGVKLRADRLAWNAELNNVSYGCGFTQSAAVEKAWEKLCNVEKVNA